MSNGSCGLHDDHVKQFRQTSWNMWYDSIVCYSWVATVSQHVLQFSYIYLKLNRHKKGKENGNEGRRKEKVKVVQLQETAQSKEMTREKLWLSTRHADDRQKINKRKRLARECLVTTKMLTDISAPPCYCLSPPVGAAVYVCRTQLTW